MRWRYETPDEKTKRLDNWHPMFCWVPRWSRQDGYVMWLEKCLRKRNHNLGEPVWDYRPITILERDLRAS